MCAVGINGRILQAFVVNNALWYDYPLFAVLEKWHDKVAHTDCFPTVIIASHTIGSPK